MLMVFNVLHVFMIVYCGLPPTVSDTIVSQMNFSYGMTANYTCDKDYVMTDAGGSDVGQIQCQADGKWPQPGFYCKWQGRHCTFT